MCRLFSSDIYCYAVSGSPKFSPYLFQRSDYFGPGVEKVQKLKILRKKGSGFDLVTATAAFYYFKKISTKIYSKRPSIPNAVKTFVYSILTASLAVLTIAPVLGSTTVLNGLCPFGKLIR